MNEVEKLYENAGIKKGIIPCPANYYGYDCTRNNQDDKDCSCAIEGYPLFTAEKQLELIKWLGKNKNGFGLFDDGTESLSCHCDFHWEWFRKDFYAEDFDSALAGLINTLWQDLIEEERKQIKNILESEVRE